MKSASQPVVIPLWPDKAPGTENWSEPEQEILIPRTNLKLVRNVTQPTLTAYLPDPSLANGTSVIVCPGGGFQFFSMENESTDVAQWLTTRGVAAFVLKYRLIPTGSDEDFLSLFRLMFAPPAILEHLSERKRLRSKGKRCGNRERYTHRLRSWMENKP